MSSKLNKENKTSFLKNVLMLMFSQVVVKLLGLVYRVAIVGAEGFGDTGNGYYSTGYQIYMILLAISSIGIPNVISKLVSERIASGDYKGAHRLFKMALKMFTGFGIFLSLLLFFSADFIATDLLHAGGVKYTLMVLAPALTFVSCSAVMRGYFAGLGSMKASGSSQVIEQFFNCLLSIGFVYACVGKDTAVMAAAGNLSTTLACAISLSYLIIFYRRRRGEIKTEISAQTVPQEDKSRGQLVKIILTLSIPITMSSLISTANSAIDIFTVSDGIQKAFSGILNSAEALEQKAMELYGTMQKAEVITHLPLAISGTLCAAIVPVISSLIAKKEYKGLSDKISSATLINSLIIFPCMGGIMILAAPVLKLLYPSAPQGDIMLILLCVTLPFSSLTYVLNGILYGAGRQFVPAVSLAIASAVKLILNLVLIPYLNIYGAIIGTLVYQVLVFAIEVIVVFRTVPIKLDLVKLFLKPMLSAGVMTAAVFGFYRLISALFGNALSTMLSVLVGAIVYLLVILLLRTLTEEDIKGLPMGGKLSRLFKKLRLI